jgi:hypothetical protein
MIIPIIVIVGGIGVPMVALSGKTAAHMIGKDFGFGIVD